MIHVGIAIAILMGSLLLGVSIPFAFGAGTIYMYTMLGGTFATTLPVGFNGINTMVLLAIPTFIMAGGFIEKGKVGDELVSVVEMLVGRFRGGLMLAVSYASAIFGAICGSAAATCSCIGSIMAPKLKMAGYSKGLSAALISSSAPLGLLIPPSSLMIMYAWVSGESVLACFLSTVIPGVCLATLLGVVGMILAQREGVQPLENWVPIYSAPGLKKTWHATPALLLPVIILGGIYGGVMTPTEAACVSTLYCIPVAIYIYRGMKWSDAPEILKETGTTTGVIMVMLFFVSMLSRYFIYEDLPGALVDMIYLFTTNKNVILLMMNVFMIIMGMLMDDGSALLLSTPILVPIAKEIGVEVNVIRKVNNLYKAYVYLWHLLDPDKYQYSKDIVGTHEFEEPSEHAGMSQIMKNVFIRIVHPLTDLRHFLYLPQRSVRLFQLAFHVASLGDVAILAEHHVIIRMHDTFKIINIFL